MRSDSAKRIVLVGGGHTHALVVSMLKAKPLKSATVTVINPGKTAPYSGMLPGFVAGHYRRHQLDIDLEQLTRNVGASLLVGSAVTVDTRRKVVGLADGTEVSYDLASIDVGITSHMPALGGFLQYAVPAKPLDDFSARWDSFRSAAGPKQVVVIGGGIAGAELAMAMAFALKPFALKQGSGDVSVKLLDRGRVLSTSSRNTQRHIGSELRANGVEVLEHINVAEVTASGVKLADGTHITANFTVGAAGATPHSWLSEIGLKMHSGFIEVDATLQSSESDVFAVGDCAHMAFDPRPKAGVYAVRQAPVLLNNLHNRLVDKTLDTYTPQADYLKLVSLGGKRAFGEKNGMWLSGRLMWLLKNHIDQAFMKQF